MTTLHLTALALAALLAAGTAVAQQKDVTPRKDMDPWDRSKVKQVEAKRWTRFGADATRTDTVSGNIPGKQSCSTTIGSAPPPANQPRFGPQQQKNQIVVVTGSVINVCK